MRTFSSLALIVTVLALPLSATAGDESEDADLGHLPVWTGDYTIVDRDPEALGCGGQITDATPNALSAFVDRYDVRALGPVRLASESFERTLSHTYDEASGLSTPVKLEQVGRSRTLVQRYQVIDDEGASWKIDLSCSLACTGAVCISSGCVPNGSNCTPHSCLSLVNGATCTGTCTKNSSGGPNPDNKD